MQRLLCLSSVIRQSLGLALLATCYGLHWKCDEKETVCEVFLEVDHRLTMMDDHTLVEALGGQLVAYNQRDQAVLIERVITGDGWPEPRVVIAINGSLPGPLLEVHEGQIMRVHVHNKMASESTSIHWHGQTQRGSPFMDGVAFGTQCPILPGQTFTYQFKAEPAGTHWYHSHSGSQSGMGMQGGLVVHPKEGPNKYAHQFTMLVTDWNHDWDSTMNFLKMTFGMYVNRKNQGGKINLSGSNYSLFNCHSLLINGRARFVKEDGFSIPSPLETFTVQAGELYRFRVIHSGTIYPFRISVDGHNLTVVATDGIELLNPVKAESVILTTGERYDFEVRATQPVANYWIRAVTLEYPTAHIGQAILHYTGAPNGTDPQSQGRACTPAAPCVVVNCPFLYYPEGQNTQCVNVEKLRSVDEMPGDVASSQNVKEYFINFGFPGLSLIMKNPSAVNGIQGEFPVVSALTQPQDVHNRCPGDGYRCGVDEQCKCMPVLDLHNGDVIQLVALNLGDGKGWDHPMHMHGHSFWVVKVGYPLYDRATGVNIGDNPDINCGGNISVLFCNQARWSNESWRPHTVPDLELQHPVLKDTVNVPTGGYVVVRFKADNPGLWSVHCHISLHLEDGMLMFMNESFPLHPPPPPGFPRCGSFTVPRPVTSNAYRYDWHLHACFVASFSYLVFSFAPF